MAPKVHKNEKGGPDPGNGAAGSESKQNKGVREGSFGPKKQLFALFDFWARKRKKSQEFGNYIKIREFEYFQLLGQNGTRKT